MRATRRNWLRGQAAETTIVCTCWREKTSLAHVPITWYVRYCTKWSRLTFAIEKWVHLTILSKLSFTRVTKFSPHQTFLLRIHRKAQKFGRTKVWWISKEVNFVKEGWSIDPVELWVCRILDWFLANKIKFDEIAQFAKL